MPPQNRVRHGGALQRQLEAVWRQADAARDAQQAVDLDDLGLRVEFESFPDIELAFESLARERSGIERLNVRQDGDRTLATVFVPDGMLGRFERLVGDYAIRGIRAASLRALWTDTATEFPSAEEGTLWWEVWLPVRRDRQAVVESFRERAEAQGMRVVRGQLVFLERTVLLVSASLEQMQHSMLPLNGVAELRRAKETAEFFDSLRPEEQQQWLDGLLARTQFPADADDHCRLMIEVKTKADSG